MEVTLANEWTTYTCPKCGKVNHIGQGFLYGRKSFVSKVNCQHCKVDLTIQFGVTFTKIGWEECKDENNDL